MTSVSQIRFKQVQSDEDWKTLRDFAKSFGHKIVDTVNPYILIFNGDKLFAYTQVVRTPFFFTAWHTDPAICNQRDMREAMTQLEGYAFLEHGEALVVSSDDSAFTPEIMAKLGYKKLGNLYTGAR